MPIIIITMKALFSFVAIGVLSLCLTGCGGGSDQPYVTPQRLDKGLVIVLPGIYGRLWISENICRGLIQGGVEQAVEIYDWTYQGKYFPLYNLGAVDRNHRVARQIAQHVRDYRQAHPGRPVTLVGYSGGGSLAVWTAEATPEGGLDGIVLLSAPLVPQYNLTEALERSPKGIVSFYSDRDVFFMALGTSLFGTMDKHHVASAGKLGFVPPEACSPTSQAVAQAPAATQPATTAPATAPTTQPAQYKRLYQISWQPEMAKLGYDGTHLTIGERAFVAQYVAPLVRATAWDETFISRVSKGQCPLPTTYPATCPARAPWTPQPEVH